MSEISKMFGGGMPKPAAAIKMPDRDDPALQHEQRRKLAAESATKGRESTRLADSKGAYTGDTLGS